MCRSWESFQLSSITGIQTRLHMQILGNFSVVIKILRGQYLFCCDPPQSCNTTYLAMQKFGPLDIWTCCITFNLQNSKFIHIPPHINLCGQEITDLYIVMCAQGCWMRTKQKYMHVSVYQPYPFFPSPASFSDNHSFEALYGGHWFSVWFIIMHVSKLQPSMYGQHNFEALYGGQ